MLVGGDKMILGGAAVALLGAWIAGCASNRPAVSTAGPTAPAGPSTYATAIVSGRVISADDQAPLARARVVLTGTPLTEARAAITDARGRFRLDRLPAGRFTVSVSRTGFVTTTRGSPDDDAPPLELGPGDVHTDVDFELVPAGVIPGRVLDEDGAPFAGARVHAIRPRFGGDRSGLVVAASAVTDDRGAFRLIGLPAALYYLAASDPAFEPPGDAGNVAHFGLTYYPSATFLDEATRVRVDPGRTSPPAEITLHMVEAVQISGSVAPDDGRTLVDGAVTLSAERADRRLMFTPLSVTLSPDGGFVFRDVPPGRYAIRALGRTARDGLTLYGQVLCTVSDRDLSSISVLLSPGAHLSGRMRFAGRAAPPAANRRGVRVVAMAVEDVPFANAHSEPLDSEDGFELRGVMPGDHVVRVEGLPPGWALTGVSLSGRDVTDTPLDLEAGQHVRGLQVTVTDDAATLSGRVLDEAGRPAPQALVLVFPTDRRQWRSFSRLVRQNRPDADGRFRLEGVPAGEYLILATDEVDERSRLDTDAFDRLSARAGRVAVTAGEERTLDLRLDRVDRDPQRP
jgi:hypothetical protein